MKFWSNSFGAGEKIPARFAFGKPHPETHVELSDNQNPHLAWSELPDGTESLVILAVDVDAPSKPDNVNKDGMTVPADLPRVDFYHWVLVDLAPDGSPIEPGEFCNGVTPRGKGAAGPRGTRRGLNNYTQWFEGDADMAGKYFGYDGPCPPWNDERVHHYHFTLFATDLERCPVDGGFTGDEVRAAIAGHVLAEASFAGTYAICASAEFR